MQQRYIKIEKKAEDIWKFKTKHNRTVGTIDKKLEKLLHELEYDINRINKNIELMKKKFEEQKQIYEEELKELNESKEMYLKELN